MSDKRIQETVYIKPQLHEFLKEQSLNEEVSFSEMCNIAFDVFVEKEKEISKMFEEIEQTKNSAHLENE